MAKNSGPPKPPDGDRSHSPDTAPSYQVGYGRPPMESRFKPGQSGNLKGRPKRQRNVRTVLEEALNERVKVHLGGRARSVSKLDGFVVTVVNDALLRDDKARAMLLALMRSTGMMGEVPESASAEPVTANDADIVADFLRRHRATTENMTAPENKTPDANTPSKAPKP